MRFIGDVHGNFEEYYYLTLQCEKSIQCGDMGIGFDLDFPKISFDHRFIRGNHDNPAKCTKIANWIKDGTFFEEDSIFCLGGAWSIDWEYRQRYEEATGRKVWWPNEECSVPKLQKIIDYYTECKPEVVVTHDCPTIMAHELNSHHKWDKSKTRQALDVMFETHQPDVWVHGHHHISLRRKIEIVEFISLAELEFVDI